MRDVLDCLVSPRSGLGNAMGGALGIAPPQVVTTGSYTLVVVVDPAGGSFSLSGTENHVPWGPYSVTPEQLAADEHNLRAIAIAGTGTVGQTLTATTGLWIGDRARALSITRQWYRGATPISGATGLTYVLVSADGGQSITCRETVGDTTVASNAISVAAGFTSPNSLPPEKRFFWGDMTDTSTLFQNTAGTTPATAVGNPVQRVNDKSGNGRHIWKTDANNPSVVAGGVNWNRGKLYAQGWSGLTTNMEVFALIEPTSATAWVLGGKFGDSGAYLGIAENGSGSTLIESANFGTPTYSVNGTDITSPTRDKLYDAVKDTSGLKVMAARGVDLTGLDATFAPLGMQMPNTYSLTGTVRHYVITTGLTTQERSDLINWLMGQA